VLKERIQEILDFTRSESPYQKANKGWINEDIFLDLRPNSDALKQGNEFAKLTLLWSPINNLLYNIFLILIICSLIVFSSISFIEGRFNLNLFDSSFVKIDDNEALINPISEKSDSILIEKESFIDENQSLITVNPNNSEELQLIEEKQLINNNFDEVDNKIEETNSNKDIKDLTKKKNKSNFI